MSPLHTQSTQAELELELELALKFRNSLAEQQILGNCQIYNLQIGLGEGRTSYL